MLNLRKKRNCMIAFSMPLALDCIHFALCPAVRRKIISMTTSVESNSCQQ